MIKSIKHFYDKKLKPAAAGAEGVTSREATDHSLRLATAALLIEITRADHDVKEEELEVVAGSLRNTFSLSAEETEELVSLATEEARGAVSFYQFTHLINKGFSYEQKKEIVELLWRVVFADSKVDKHEEHSVRKIAGLLHVPHRDFIAAKLKARDGGGGGAKG